MTLVIDASVALKWVLPEDGSDRAAVLAHSETFIAPDFLLLECANVLALRVRRGLLTPEEAISGLELLSNAGVRLVPGARHVVAAHRLAMTLQRTVYDSLYLALALAEGVGLVTADLRFASAVEANPVHKSVVRRL